MSKAIQELENALVRINRKHDDLFDAIDVAQININNAKAEQARLRATADEYIVALELLRGAK